MPSRLKVWNGSAWVAKPVKVWTGSAWVTKQIKFWNGSAWIGDTSGATPVAPVFRNNWLSTYAARPGAIVVDKPAGTIENDVVLVGIVHAKGMPAQNDLVPAAGFTKIGTSTWVRDNSNFDAKFEMYWRRATASEPANYAFDVWGTSNNQAYAVSYSGCPISGDPIDVFSINFHTNRPTDDLKGNAGRGLSVNTTQPNDKLIWLGHNWDASAAMTPPSLDGGSTFMTERVDHLIYSADETIAAAGATGDYTQTQASTNPWVACMIALKGM